MLKANTNIQCDCDNVFITVIEAFVTLERSAAEFAICYSGTKAIMMKQS